MWLLLAFIAVPLIEIGLFIQVGGLIGLWPTLAIVLLTAFLGARLVRDQATREIVNLRRSFSELRDPSEPLAHTALIVLAGALLLTPGFFTDTMGLLLLIAPVRSAVLAYLRRRVRFEAMTFGATGPAPRHGPAGGPETIDADYEEIPSPPHPTHGTSGWTRH
jgi:UPF0716 protein FxsA